MPRFVSCRKTKRINDETRSGLFYESIRLLREVRPRFALFENVRNLLSHEKGETFQEVLFQIAKAGYDAEWSIISAKDLGACHLRERIWIVAYSKANPAMSQNLNLPSIKNHQHPNLETVISQLPTPTNGSSTSTRIVRINEETSSSSQKGENKISKSERSSKSTGSRTVQSFQKHQTLPTPTAAEHKATAKVEKPIWKHAFLNSKERRTLSPELDRICF